ncbi:hypothetical protein [Sinorhizobium medicae]|uniref:hypothetical protein n=1 Tax=Sinorhizobium medicae TaxID=110321 RepID=UPI000485AB7F|nr:hypothetical protein [Sinorhizobium medicae]
MSCSVGAFGVPAVDIDASFSDLLNNLCFTASGWAIVGGCSSDFMWDVWRGPGYQFSETFSAGAGYRGTGVDHEYDGFAFDVVQQGPVLGVAFRS